MLDFAPNYTGKMKNIESMRKIMKNYRIVMASHIFNPAF